MTNTAPLQSDNLIPQPCVPCINHIRRFVIQAIAKILTIVIVVIQTTERF